MAKRPIHRLNGTKASMEMDDLAEETIVTKFFDLLRAFKKALMLSFTMVQRVSRRSLKGRKMQQQATISIGILQHYQWQQAPKRQ